MENLLKLLKQYWKRTFNDEILLRIYYEEKTDCFCWMYQPRPWMKLEQGQMLETPVVFSKSFGFIKWLVDNDKIDYEKVDKSWNDEMSFVDFKLDNIMEIRIKVVLMLLAIQDEPIEFLISILK